MTLSYKILGQLEPTQATLSTVYTVPTGAGNYAVISTINVANRGVDPASIRIACRPAGATIEDKHYIVYDSIISGSTTQAYTIGITLAATDVVDVYSSNSDTAFNLFGSENS